MSKIYMGLYDFFHAIANFFWHKYINVIKKQSNPKKKHCKSKDKI